MIHLPDFLNSIRNALRGVAVVFRNEQSFRLQCAAAVLALAASYAFRIDTFELLVILLLIAAVLTLEIVNSVLERVIDSFKPRIHPVVRDIKDIMAGAVLLVSVVAATVGAVIFWPHVAPLFG